MKKISMAMKLTIACITLFTSTMAFSLTAQDQARVYENLNAARQEIQTLKAMLPGFARKYVEPSLNSIESKIALSQSIVASTPATDQNQYYCSIDSSFDGSFSGSGATELEAKTRAKKSCTSGSRHNGLFCSESSLKCQKQ